MQVGLYCEKDPTAKETPWGITTGPPLQKEPHEALQEGPHCKRDPTERRTLWGIARGTPRGIASGDPLQEGTHRALQG